MRAWTLATLLAAPLTGAAAHAADGGGQVAHAPTSAAARPRATLTVAPGAPAECPDQAELGAAVAERLGYDPFDATAERRLTVRFEARGRALVAVVESATDPGGGAAAGERAGPGTSGAPRRRELRSEAGDCRELGRAVALALSVAIDPESLGRPPGTAPSASAAPPPAASTEAPDGSGAGPGVSAPPGGDPGAPAPHQPGVGPAGATPRATPGVAGAGGQGGRPGDEGAATRAGTWGAGVAIGGRARAGAAPVPLLGVGVRGEATAGTWALGLEAAWFAPRAVTRGEGRGFTVNALAVGVVPCLRLAPAELCLLAGGERLAARGTGVDVPRAGQAVALRLGAGAGLRWAPAAGVHVGLRADLGVAPAPVALVLDGATTYRQAPVAGGLALWAGTP